MAFTRMKLHSKFVWERFVTAIKIDRIPLFDVRCWTFDVRCSLATFSIRPAVFLGPAAGLTPETRHLKPKNRFDLGQNQSSLTWPLWDPDLQQRYIV